MLLSLGSTSDGTTVAELGAFCVNPSVRWEGRLPRLIRLDLCDWASETSHCRSVSNQLQGHRTRGQHA